MSWIIKFLKAILDMFKKELDLETPTIIKPNPEPVVVTPEPKIEVTKPEVKKVIPPSMWYPDAFIPKAKMQTQGRYRKGYPEGAVIHATAGWDRDFSDALNTHNYGAKEGLCWITISPDGRILQSHPLDQFGSHAGESMWDGLPGNRISRFLLGIEVCSSGQLDFNLAASYSPKRVYKKDETRILDNDSNHWGPKGVYSKFTTAQEDSLLKLILWLHRNNPEVFKLDNVVGHHECAGVMMLKRWRKVDPGGCLSMPMDEYRSYLKRLV